MIEISLLKLGYCVVFVVIVLVSSFFFNLKLSKTIIIASLRCSVQLLLMGYVLAFILRENEFWINILLFVWMSYWASDSIAKRINTTLPLKKIIFLPLLINSFCITFFITCFVVGAEQWYEAKYFIVLGGMVLGNSMNAITLSIERFLSSLQEQEEQFKCKLYLGATYDEGCKDFFIKAITTSLMPTFNSMCAIGLVFIPGMMSGQIIAGQTSFNAVKYQIVIMFMILISVVLGSLFIVKQVQKQSKKQFSIAS